MRRFLDGGGAEPPLSRELNCYLPAFEKADSGTQRVFLYEAYAGRFQRGLDRCQVIDIRGATPLLKIHNRVARNSCSLSEIDLIHRHKRPAGTTLLRRNHHHKHRYQTYC